MKSAKTNRFRSCWSLISTGRAVDPVPRQGKDFLNPIETSARMKLMPGGVRSGFYGGFSVALLLVMFLLWLWQPERQVRRHTENLFCSMEQKNWRWMAELVSNDYHDQWGHDRELMLERVRFAFSFLRAVKIEHSSAAVRIDNSRGKWTGKITIGAAESAFAGLIQDRVNSVATPFELEWHHISAMPWDWKLVRVANPGLEIPAGEY